MLQFGLYYAPDAYGTDQKLMGRQSAGRSLLRAAVQARPDRIWCYTASRTDADHFGRLIASLGLLPLPEMRFISFLEPNRLARCGTLYRPDPDIGEDAWHRQFFGTARDYSLCGITHTLSSHGVYQAVTRLLHAPVFPWDAVICTSTVARGVVRDLLENEKEHQRQRLGSTRWQEPQLPVIPLGTHCDDYAFSAETREASRRHFGLAPEDIVVLFAGRLVFHAKAHPMPMFLALQEAAQRSSRELTLVLFGQFPNVSIADAFQKEACQFAPSVRLIVLDGGVAANRELAWSCADIFTSFADNIQETFGLTPVEAMAAGLPVVVSDWNGYKDTVRDGVDGFRIPVWTLPPGHKNDFAHQLDARLTSYDRHIGMVSQFTAVDVKAAAEAFVELINSSALRAEMGSAGRRRVRELFDWRVVFQSYVALWENLSIIRGNSPPIDGERSTARRPDRPDPFTLFRTYPTHHVGKQTWISFNRYFDTNLLPDLPSLSSVNYAARAIPTQSLIDLVLAFIGDGVKVEELEVRCPEIRREELLQAVTWLAKMGVVILRTEGAA
ncbi:glycosyltransferase family 4 protein [Bradyrhizobium liaoningense]|uniref:glycosyltransferase family 4 protein n=1 Tax=Bradyrhizobium liaoningense TaxID=43992 RepID=UPI001BA4416A|nr:glycosyltransferase family 4 protein [Bradyrhizobium liaoningense]MBR0904585.1 glycosyltransferase family 4 protein [Bradyrhizobium liaoningense]